MGRPFRKISSSHLPIARQQVVVWNRKKSQTTDAPHTEDFRPNGANALLSSNAPEVSPQVFGNQEFSAIRFDQAEESKDTKYFRTCVLKFPHAVYLWTQKSGKSYSNFLAFMYKLKTLDSSLYREWELMKDGRGAASQEASRSVTKSELQPSQHDRKVTRKPSRKSKRRRAAAYKAHLSEHKRDPVNTSASCNPDVHTGQLADSSVEVNLDVATEDGDSAKQDDDDPAHLKETKSPVTLPVPPEPPDVNVPIKRNAPSWTMDPTPPHLKEVLSIPKPKLGEKPLELNPALFWDLDNKATTRWNRKFDAFSTSGVYRL